MKKGISPLIAAVFLIAFVIAIAALASNFFTGFTKQRQAEIGEKGEKTIDCSVAVLEMDPTTVSEGTETKVVLENNGKTDIYNLRAITYNSTDVTSDDSPSPTNISKGETLYLTISPTVSDPYKIRVTTTDCPGLESVINESTTNNWEVLS